MPHTIHPARRSTLPVPAPARRPYYGKPNGRKPKGGTLGASGLPTPSGVGSS